MRRRSLRLRLTVAFGLGAAVLSLIFGTLAYVGVRHIAVTERQNHDLRQAYVNAALIRGAVIAGTPTIPALIASVDTATSSVSLLHRYDVWYAKSVPNPLLIPIGVRRLANAGVVSRQVVVEDGVPEIVIGVPIPAIHAEYYVSDNLSDLDRTLRLSFLILLLGALFTTGLGVLAGRWITKRAMAPLEVASRAATEVAGGALDTRIPEDPRNTEVAALASSFNAMVERLVERLNRDARFAGDVSHELRSPLTTLATSVEVMRHHRDTFDPDSQAAFDLLAADVHTFQVLVEDLLEIARYDAGAASTHLETLDAHELVRQCVRSAVRRHQLRDVPVHDDGAEEAYVTVDRRRFERVMTNLLDNASRYAGGATAVSVHVEGDEVVINVDDEGPGVSSEDRAHIFNRFYRGEAANARGSSRGTGLGLALVADHVTHFQGTIHLLDAPTGGSRFQVRLPRREPDEESV